MRVGDGYHGLVDEYSNTSNAEDHLYATPDIVSPDSAPADETLFDTVRLLSTPTGCRKWIRQELLEHELEFTSKLTLTIFTATWNVNGKKPQVSLDSWLLFGNTPPDLFIVGFQEVQSLSGISVMSTDETRGAVWQAAVEKCIAKYGEEYSTICVKQMVGIFLVVVVKKCHLPYVQNIAVSDAGTGFMRTGGNKGAVGCRFELYDKTLCCVSSHLAAHGYNLERRNQDFHDVLRKSVFIITNPEVSPFDYRDPLPRESNSTKSPMEDQPDLFHAESRYKSAAEATAVVSMLDHDIVFWTGDLNYRINDLESENVVALIDDQDWMTLAKHDQLLSSMQSGEAFQEFEEMPLTFAPTYKCRLFEDGYDRDEDDNELKRTPAWTDRILWRDRSKYLFQSSDDENSYAILKLELGRTDETPGKRPAYTSALRADEYRRHELYSSDHRPVSACFKLDVSALNILNRNRVVDEIQMTLRKRHNLLRPRLSLSATVIDLGIVEFSKHSVGPTPLVVSNLGFASVSVKVCTNDLPPWLQISENSETEIAPSESTYFRFCVHVRPGTGVSNKLNMGLEKLMTCVPILIQGTPEAFISVTGQYCPTAFGNSIMDLAAHPKPFSVDLGTRFTVTSQRTLVVPKEIHLLVSYLVRGCTSITEIGDDNDTADTCSLHTEKELFLHSLSPDNVEVRKVQRNVDSCTPIPDGTPSIAVTSCLIALLESFEDSVVPSECRDAVLSLARTDLTTFNLSDLQVLLEHHGARAPVFNTVVYIYALLNELTTIRVNGALESGHPDVTQILTTFSGLMLGPSNQGSENDADIDDRLRFTKVMMALCKQGSLPVTFDYSFSTVEQ